MVDIQHGDLLEQRRGGVDVLRTMVRNLAVHEQSGAVQIRTAGNDESHAGWLLFRLGHPVMAFHTGTVEKEGLEALLSIEEDAMDVNNHVELYELSMNALRSVMSQHPSSVLHLEHQAQAREGDSWWSSVRLPSTSWRRAARLEDIDEMALSTEHRRREGMASEVEQGLLPGGVYILDSPDPHPLIHLGVELAERGMPLLGLFGLPHAQTEATKRLPSPQCYALMSPHGDFEVLGDRDSILSTVNAFQWGNERSVLLLDGLDRLGNAMGDAVMLDVFRSICDGVRFNDHIVLCTTDLEMFETNIRHALTGEASVLRTTTVEGWLHEPDTLWDHPVLLAPDEEEEKWLEAQIRHQGSLLGAEGIEAVMEGGSTEVDEATRRDATEQLESVVASWVDERPSPETGSDLERQTTAVGGTPWRPETEPVINEGRFISDSPRITSAPVTVVEERVLKRTVQPKTKVAHRPPTLRPPQRMVARSAPPTLPDIQHGLTSRRSSAVAKASHELPDWPQVRRVPQAYRKENMDGYAERQNSAVERQQSIKTPLQAKALRDNVATSRDLTDATLPATRIPRTVELPSATDDQALPNTLHVVDDSKQQPARESSALPQRQDSIDEMYERWSTFEEQDGLDATALYSEKGEALKRYKGDSS